MTQKNALNARVDSTLDDNSKRTSRIRNLVGLLILAIGLGGTYGYANVLTRVYPIEQWLVWKLALIWSAVLGFSAMCVSFGHFFLTRVLKLVIRPALEAAVFSMATGIVAFALVMYAAGALRWYGPWFSLALPIVTLATCGHHGIRLMRALAREWREPRQHSVWSTLVFCAGIICVLTVYLGALTPDSLNYDSTWYHLVIAQDYVREHGIVAFPADYNKNYPQMTGLISTWGWPLPGFDVPLRWMLSLHFEFSLFVWTLVSVSAGIRALTRSKGHRATWASFFLFPVIFVYDHNLGGAADHICAFFSVPILLATLRLCATFSAADAVLLAIVSAGCLLSKYQATYLIAPVALVVLAYWALRLAEHGFPALAPYGGPRVSLRRLAWSLPLVAATGLLLVAPHFLKQWIFHHNPVYPFLQSVFKASTPTVPNGAFIFEQTAQEPAWRPTGTLVEKLLHALKLFFTFSFEPHYSFNNNVPMFGSLFTLLLPTIPFVRERKRIAIATLIVSGAVLIWALVYNVDRNLQVFMPIMVCVTGALILQVWSLGLLARVGLSALVALQIIWGADALVYSEHSRIQSSFELIRSGFEHHAETRWSGYRSDFRAIDRVLPPDARVLLHTSHLSLGIDRKVYFDWAGYQGLIAYGHVRTPAELYAYYRSLGITHLLYTPGVRPAPTKQEEVLWHALLNHSQSLGSFGGFRLYALPAQSPPQEAPYTVAAIGLPGYSDGVYAIAAMGTDEYLPGQSQHYEEPKTRLPSDAKARSDELAHVDAVLVGTRAEHRARSGSWTEQFRPGMRLPGGFTLYLRKP